jgi:acyl carrier protein
MKNKKYLNLDKRVRDIIISVFRIKKISNKNYSINTVKEWDSFGHYNLVMELEKKFKIKFSDDEIFRLINLKKIIYHVNKKI